MGLGLSVDVYSPDILELCDELRNQHINIAYLEIFHAAPEALESVRTQLPVLPLAYHAEGLWFTQPDWETAGFSQTRLEATARALRILQSHWVNQECATKEISGFAVGTYLPPLFTEESAEITAYHAWRAQQTLDDYDWGEQETSPLLLLEGPPLSYFSLGDISYAEFFGRISSRAPCGLVLDLGHVWTVYRYTGAWRNQSLGTFFERFLARFPLERIIQIHLAGLHCHPNILPQVASEEYQNPPFWIDAHEASIPEELFELLIQVLQEPRLINLKGVALEVDSKNIPLICREIHTIMEIGKAYLHFRPQGTRPAIESQPHQEPQAQDCQPIRDIRHMLIRQYQEYLALATGKGENCLVLPQEWERGVAEGLILYGTYYLPYEILIWGGDVKVMFPRTCQLLDRQGIPLSKFVEFWLTHSRASESEYDFFLIKIQRFMAFLRRVLPTAFSTVQQEAVMLSHDYARACQRLM